MLLKDEVKQLIDKLPEDCTIEDIHYTLYVRSKINKGLEDIEKGNVLTHEEAVKRMKEWLKQ